MSSFARSVAVFARLMLYPISRTKRGENWGLSIKNENLVISVSKICTLLVRNKTSDSLVITVNSVL